MVRGDDDEEEMTMMDVRRGAGGIGAGPVWHKAGWKKRFVKSTDFERDGSGVSQRDRYERENGHGMKEEKRIIRGKRSLPFSCRPRKLTPSFECVHVSKRVPQSQSDWCVLSCIELTLLHPSIEFFVTPGGGAHARVVVHLHIASIMNNLRARPCLPLSTIQFPCCIRRAMCASRSCSGSDAHAAETSHV